MKKRRRISHPDEEDPGTICALLGAMKVNVWGGEEHYIPSVWNKKRKSRAARAGRTGQGRGGGCELGVSEIPT